MHKGNSLNEKCVNEDTFRACSNPSDKPSGNLAEALNVKAKQLKL